MLREKLHKTIVIFALLGFASSCAHRAPVAQNPGPENPEVMGPVIPNGKVEEAPVEDYGPQIPPEGISTATSTPVVPPTETVTATATATATSTAPAKLCIVLGPGMAKAMAEAAVLEAIRKAKIPVSWIVGTEMGAIVGGLYAFSNGSTNNLQWQLFKINKDNYFNFPMLSLQEPKSSGKKLNEILRGFFKDSRIEVLPVRFATSAVEEDGDNTVELDSGSLADALSASVAVQGIFDSWKIGARRYRSSAAADPTPVELAKKLGGNFIVLVDVLVDNGSANAKSRFHRAFTSARSLIKLQKKEANFVIPIDTSAIAFDDFSRKAEIQNAGSAAAEKSVPELKAAWERWSAGTR